MKTSWALLIVFLAGFTARMLFVWIFGIPPAILDGHEYDVMARNIIAGRALDTAPASEPDLPIRVPLYGFFVAAIYTIFGTSLMAVVVAQILASTILSLLVFHLGRRCFKNAWSAFAGALLLALHLPSVVHCGVLYPDTLFALLLCVSFLTILRLLETFNIPWAIVAGLMLGLTTLCKEAAQLFVVLVVILVFFAKAPSMRRRTALSAAVLAGFLAVMAPWTIRNCVRYHAFVPTGTLSGFNFLTGNYRELLPPGSVPKSLLPPDILKKSEEMNWIDKNDYFIREGKRVFIENLSDLPRRVLLKTGIIFVDYPRLSLTNNIGYDSVIGPRRAQAIVWAGVLQNSLYVLLALGAVFSCRGASRRVVLLAVLLLFYFWAGYVLTRSLSRYSISLYPLVCIFSGCTLSRWLGFSGRAEAQEASKQLGSTG